MGTSDNSGNRDRRRDDQLAGMIARQSTLISQMSSRLQDLKDVPRKLAVVEEKLTNLSDLNEQVSSLVVVTTKHTTILQILGTAIVILFPLVVTWNYQLRTEITTLQRQIIQIQERQEFRNVPSVPSLTPPKDEKLFAWDVWHLTRF
jgi:hypothetical protein